MRCNVIGALRGRVTPLTSSHLFRMVCQMKTTLNIDDTVMAQLRREAARQGRTMAELVETALRLLLRSPRPRGKYKPGDPAPGYWDPIIGAGRPIDTDKYFVISADTLANLDTKDPNAPLSSRRFI